MSKIAKKPTLHDVAKLAGVSRATVSYVLNGRRGGKSRISGTTRQNVINAAAELRYTPNTSARNLRRRRTDRICVAFPRLGAPYNEILAQELQQAADEHGYFMIVTVIGSAERELQVFEQLRQGLADGAVITDTCFLDDSDLALLAEAGLAIVVVNSHADIEPKGFDVVRTNRAKAYKQVVNHLLNKGHHRIVLLSDSSKINHAQRVREFLNAFRDQGVSIDHRLLEGNVKDRRTAYQSTRAFLEHDQPPTAILNTTDTFAVGALLAARDAGVRVPDELAVIGIGNIPEGEITTPPLSTIGSKSLDFSSIVAMLFDRLEGRTLPEGRLLEFSGELILRGSA